VYGSAFLCEACRSILSCVYPAKQCGDLAKHSSIGSGAIERNPSQLCERIAISINY
jgi:hypothetical protein